MLAKFKTWPLPSCVFELVSHAAARYAFSFVPDLQKGLFLSHVSCHSRSPTRSVLEQNYDPCPLSSSYLCRMQTYCHPFRQKKTTRVRCLIWQPSQTQPRQYVRRLLSASFCSASVHSPHAWRPYYLMSEVSTEQCMLWSFYFRYLTVYYTRYELYILSAILYYTRYQG